MILRCKSEVICPFYTGVNILVCRELCIGSKNQFLIFNKNVCFELA